MEGLLVDGRYRVGGKIGSGGMSVVHQAEDLRLGRRIALKLIEGSSSDALVERLFREARAAARADHPAVVTVFAYGSDPATGLHYLAMERLDGEDLAARIARERPLPVGFVLKVGIEIADALAAVHATGVVHRDLKPSNVFLARRGLRVDDIKLLDFGVAKQLDLQTLTGPGQVIGTLAYMAPEQLIDPKRVDSRSDIYALGAVLFECLCGEPPFKGSSITEVTSKILYDEPAVPLSQRPEVPAPVAAVVERCMARRTRDRYGSAVHVREALIELRDGAVTAG